MASRGDREEPEQGEPIDSGIRSMDLGSSFPEGSYRPVPIVWLAGAWLLQNVLGLLLFAIFIGKHPLFQVLAVGLLTVALGRWTFTRGMKDAGAGWKIATVAILFANWALVALVSLGV